MSVELANASEIIGQIASTQGYSDLISACEGHSSKTSASLRAFMDRGFTDAVQNCVVSLKEIASKDGISDDVKETASNLAAMMDGQDFAIITDGTSDED